MKTDCLLSLPEVSKRCGVSLSTVHKWVRGITVGGIAVRLHSRVYGTRSKVTESALQDFLDSCEYAKFGDVHDEPLSQTEIDAAAEAAVREAEEMFL